MIARLSPASRLALGGLLFFLVEVVLIAFVDRPLSEYLRAVDAQHHALIDFFRSWTDIGKSCWYLWPSGLGMLPAFALAHWRKFTASRREAWCRTGQILGFFFACVAVSGIATDIFKPLIGRARPVVLQREGFYGFHAFSFHAHDAFNSMPSGHATTAFAVAFALIALRPRWKTGLIAFAVAVGLSRIMVNAHYLSDVIAGAAVGVLTVMILQRLFRRRGWIVVRHG